MTDWAPPPFRIKFDEARDPYTARNALGIMGTGAGFITSVTAPLSVTGGNLTIDLSGYQPLDADLTAIAALTGTNTIYYRSAANTWSPVNVSTGLAFSGGNLTATGGGGNVSNSGTPTVGQYARWVTATTIEGISEATALTNAIFNCGRLDFVSATALSFKPFNGDRIKINGAVLAIPSGGIAGLANTGVFVNGVAGQNLVASSGYYVYAFLNGATVTADFSSGHATSTTAGNVGVEIKSGDNTRTLIGLVYTSASAQFQDSAAARGVISWFNRRSIFFTGGTLSGVTTTSTSLVELGVAGRAVVLTWGTEAIFMCLQGMMMNTGITGQTALNIGIDSTTVGSVASLCQSVGGVANEQFPVATTISTFLSEGLHTLVILGLVGSGTGTYYVVLTGRMQG